MNPAERQSTVRKDIYENAYEVIATHDDESVCPFCGSVVIVEKGHNPNDSQRWLCKDCRRTFSQTWDTLIGRSKLPVTKWMMYVECFADCLTLHEYAKHCEVSLHTAWLIRRRLFACFERHFA